MSAADLVAELASRGRYHFTTDEAEAALLSAARYHGAAHQQPQVFQVMVPKNRPPITCGNVWVRFVARRNAARVLTVRFNTFRGLLAVSSPEATAFDLVGYHGHAGGLDNVGTVLAELAETLDPEALLVAAKILPVPWAQRLGYLLEWVGAGDKAEALARHVERKVMVVSPLLTNNNSAGAPRNERWKLAVNADVELDI